MLSSHNLCWAHLWKTTELAVSSNNTNYLRVSLLQNVLKTARPMSELQNIWNTLASELHQVNKTTQQEVCELVSKEQGGESIFLFSDWCYRHEQWKFDNHPPVEEKSESKELHRGGGLLPWRQHRRAVYPPAQGELVLVHYKIHIQWCRIVFMLTQTYSTSLLRMSPGN